MPLKNVIDRVGYPSSGGGIVRSNFISRVIFKICSSADGRGYAPQNASAIISLYYHALQRYLVNTFNDDTEVSKHPPFHPATPLSMELPCCIKAQGQVSQLEHPSGRPYPLQGTLLDCEPRWSPGCNPACAIRPERPLRNTILAQL